MSRATVAVLGAGIQGSCLALSLAQGGHPVDLIDRRPRPMAGTSAHTEGKIHLGFVYAKDPGGETHRRMAQGSLAFAASLEKITGLSPEQYTRGARFHYVVPIESRLSIDEIEAHFLDVEACVSEIQTRTGQTYLGRTLKSTFRRLDPAELPGRFHPRSVQAAYLTEEEAVDTVALAELLRRTVLAHPLIDFHAETQASDASLDSSDHVRLELTTEGKAWERRYAAVANCLWAGRLALDRFLGLTPERPWLFRFKAILRLSDPELASSEVPSATLIHGPFGDVVNYGDGDFYLSWYPRFKLAETRDIDGSSLYNALEGIDRQQLAREGISEMSRYVPALRHLLGSTKPFRVDGGVIFSWGASDIDDPQSGLHQRWQIGPRRHGPYVSVDTGKYTMAPLFALETHRLIEEILA